MDAAELGNLLARKSALESSLDRFEVWLIVFGILVLVGVGGESIFGICGWLVNRKLHGIEADIDNARQTELAGTKERAALAEQHAAEATKLAEGFRLDIAKANERAALAEETAERERLSRLQLEARLAVWGDSAEIQSISALIFHSVAAAGWRVQPATAIGGGAAVRGILIGTDPGASAITVQAAGALLAGLQSAGLGATSWSFERLRPPSAMMNSGFTGKAQIRLFIGTKP